MAKVDAEQVVKLKATKLDCRSQNYTLRASHGAGDIVAHLASELWGFLLAIPLLRPQLSSLLLMVSLLRALCSSGQVPAPYYR